MFKQVCVFVLAYATVAEARMCPKSGCVSGCTEERSPGVPWCKKSGFVSGNSQWRWCKPCAGNSSPTRRAPARRAPARRAST